MPDKIERHWLKGGGGTWRIAALACLATTLGLFSGRAHAQNGLKNLPALQPVMDCAKLATLTVDNATDAPVTIQSATLVSQP